MVDPFISTPIAISASKGPVVVVAVAVVFAVAFPFPSEDPALEEEEEEEEKVSCDAVPAAMSSRSIAALTGVVEEEEEAFTVLAVYMRCTA